MTRAKHGSRGPLQPRQAPAHGGTEHDEIIARKMMAWARPPSLSFQRNVLVGGKPAYMSEG